MAVNKHERFLAASADGLGVWKCTCVPPVASECFQDDVGRAFPACLELKVAVGADRVEAVELIR